MTETETRGKQPFKIWDSQRNLRKGLVVSSFEELVVRGKEKLGVPANEPARLVLESDGTQVEDGEYFRTLPHNSVLLLLRPGERWRPPGVDIFRAAAGDGEDTAEASDFESAITAIPRIVCETINALELQNEVPSWKIMDNKGRVTVVLHWDHAKAAQLAGAGTGPGGVAGGGGGGGMAGGGGPPGRVSPAPPGTTNQQGAPTAPGSMAGPMAGAKNKPPALVIQTSLEKQQQAMLNDALYTPPNSARYTSGPHGPCTGPHITVINHDDEVAGLGGQVPLQSPGPHQGGPHQGPHQGGPPSRHHLQHPPPLRLSRQAGAGSSLDSACAQRAAALALAAECDFHCCALHEEGRFIAVHKSVATSPIQDVGSQTSPQPTSSMAGGRTGMVRGGQHVRFLDIEGGRGGPPEHGGDSSESETDNTVLEEEAVTSEKFLLLIDQLSVDQKRHLTIKDIGIILERLNSKILDVERLDRESESDDCYNWTIKATIRGDVLQELGVIYNGNYYAISEHPGYKEDVDLEDVAGLPDPPEEEEEEDRL
ncbi:hypothetical protein ONE63_007934 [Megalurothrips usitatus]|uniref:CIDE-N domain-containing protein n=1 Tax=Megalurothrips usitatus TaxID=439358 RepID=A0AAV7XVP9_9NEOP|nr:hypothetical protein ONE63_007934 [Megalurothrips usitatus]